MDSGTSSEALWEQRMNELLPKLGFTPKATAIGSTNPSKTFDAACLTNAEAGFASASYAILLARDYSVSAASIVAAGKQDALQVEVWDRHEDNVPSDGSTSVEHLEWLSRAKADQARSLGLAWLPYHLMFAKLKTARPSVQLTADGTHATTTVSTGQAVLSIASRTSLAVPTDGLDDDTKAAVGFAEETILELSALSRSGAFVPDDPATRPKAR
jgi:hypothetical protein